MDSTEMHYLTYDPEEIWNGMISAYVDAGGDVLYPGDEKEILLRGVQAIVTQVFAGVDTALRMATLRYAVGAADRRSAGDGSRNRMREDGQRRKRAACRHADAVHGIESGSGKRIRDRERERRTGR